jgi:D-3-phosphoglycerate dehydrogenase
MGICSKAGRMGVNHMNVPNMISKLTAVFGGAGVNVANISNASLGNYAYTLIDTDAVLTPELLSHIDAVEGVLKARIIK